MSFAFGKVDSLHLTEFQASSSWILNIQNNLWSLRWQNGKIQDSRDAKTLHVIWKSEMKISLAYKTEKKKQNFGIHHNSFHDLKIF